MNELLTKLYRASKPKEALASQDEFKSANVLLGSDVEKFAELIVKECADTVLGFHNQFGDSAHNEIRQHFGVEE